MDPKNVEKSGLLDYSPLFPILRLNDHFKRIPSDHVLYISILWSPGKQEKDIIGNDSNVATLIRYKISQLNKM